MISAPRRPSHRHVALPVGADVSHPAGAMRSAALRGEARRTRLVSAGTSRLGSVSEERHANSRTMAVAATVVPTVAGAIEMTHVVIAMATAAVAATAVPTGVATGGTGAAGVTHATTVEGATRAIVVAGVARAIAVAGANHTIVVAGATRATSAQGATRATSAAKVPLCHVTGGVHQQDVIGAAGLDTGTSLSESRQACTLPEDTTHQKRQGAR
mmetsp:Transcript_12225/g.37478  ORF Transcript_12225/g.37478 Transcript_12225/m.37478 type:complete len:214 (-) Transcript_12225:590-1231(-)